MYQSHPVPKNSTEYSVSKKLKFLYPQSNIPVKIFNNPSHKLSTNFPQTFHKLSYPHALDLQFHHYFLENPK